MSLRTTVKKFIPAGLFPAIEPYGHWAEAVLLNTVNGFPARGLNVIGVTGTNGKTSTTYLIHRMLHEAGYKVAMMSTVAYGVGSDIRPQIHHMTNVSVPELMKRLTWMREQGAEWLVLETTSHALAQNRVWGIPYTMAVMTNVTHEHLDYHKTFERYRAAKVKLFRLANRNKKGMQVGIINADDPSAPYFVAAIKHPILYSVEKTPAELAADGGEVMNQEVLNPDGGHLYAGHVELTPERSTYQATIDGETYNIICNVPGSFNVSNSLAAVGVGHALGLTKEQIEQGIAALEGVEGRMTTINEGQDFSVIVDFAHTPDSFEKLFNDLKPVVAKTGGRLVVLFGSAGRRDEAKRAVQGKLAGEYADEVIITEEDDRDADGLDIMNQIAAGATEAGKVLDQNLFLVHDRTEAISFALGRAKPGDTVLLLGKGHEKTIERANGENRWDEIGTARAALKSLAQ